MGFGFWVVALTVLLSPLCLADDTPAAATTSPAATTTATTTSTTPTTTQTTTEAPKMNISEIETATMDHSFTNLLSYEWNQFALLDNSEINPSSNQISCQNKEFPLPPNWELASSTDITHRAAMMFGGTWSTSCVVFGDGVSLNTRGEVCGVDQLVVKNDNYTVKQCDQKILVVQKIQDHYIQEFSRGSVAVDEATSSWGKESLNNEQKDVLTLVSQGNLTKARMTYRVSSADNHLSWEGFSLTFQCKTNDTKAVPLSASARIQYSRTKITPAYVKEFSCTNDWTPFTLDIYAQTEGTGTGIQSIYVSRYEVSFLLNTTGLVQIADVRARPLPANLLVNPSFDSNSPDSIPGWSSLPTHEKSSSKKTFMPSLERKSEKEKNSPWSSVLVFNRFPNFDRGISQEISLEGKHFRQAIYVGGWSKAISVLGTPDDNYCIWVEVKDKANVTTNVLTLPFSTGTHDWEYKDGVIHLPQEKQVNSLKIYAVFRNHIGTVLFDDFVVKLGLPTQNQFNCFAGAFGDPHMITFNGDYYPFQFPGEFVLLTNHHIEVQSRHEFITPLAAAITGIAVKYENQTFSIIAGNGTDQPKIHHNKQPVTSLNTEATGFGFLSLPSIGYVTSRGSLKQPPNHLSYTLKIKNQVELLIDIYEGKAGRRQSLHLRASLPTTAHDVNGILGSCQSPLLSWREKEESPTPTATGAPSLDPSEEYHMLTANYSTYSTQNMTSFAKSWLVSTEASLFTYEAGEDPEFFRNIEAQPGDKGQTQITLQLKESDRKIAASMCKTQHLKPFLTTACEIDLMFKNLSLVDYHKYMFLTQGGSLPFESSTLDPVLNRKLFEQTDQQFYKMMMIGLVVVFIFVGIAVFFIVLMSKVRKRRRNYQMVAMDGESGGEMPSGKTT